jgi:hypothetical protein
MNDDLATQNSEDYFAAVDERDEARRIAEGWRDNFALSYPDEPHIPLPWDGPAGA